MENKNVISKEEEKKTKKKEVLWTFLSLLIAIGSIAMVLSRSTSFKIDVFWDEIQGMNIGWLIPAFFCMFGYIWFEGKAIQHIAKSLNFKTRTRDGVVYGAADVYFSAITPSASGGQPASAYFMIRDGMPGSVVAITLLYNLIFYCLALLSIATVCLIAFGKVLTQLSIKFTLLYGIGFVILIVLTGVFYLLMHKGRIIYHFCDRLIHIGEKLHIIRHGKERREKLLVSMEQYHECSDLIRKDRKAAVAVYFYNLLQRLTQLAVSFCIFMAWKGDFPLALTASAMQCFVAVGSSSVPIPGGMGVADYMMLHGFTYLLGKNMAVNMELLCRGITFYGCVLTGGIITAIGYLKGRC
ncbi:MAG: lysylphosphatidylglycerol synthase transmembrane domain-containing protein [Eubacteriales bacterium]|nr:lysylphosphatidylglycerol synthase transmembrane domain-containing protein [Eubacteriales bacterium]